MGIRLNKGLGWAKFYTYEEYNQKVKDFDKVNRKLKDYKKFLNKKFNLPDTHEEFAELIKTNSDLLDPKKYGTDYMMWASEYEKVADYKLYDIIDLSEYDDNPHGVDPETGKPKNNILVMFRPLSQHKTWLRRDDDLDYVEMLIIGTPDPDTTTTIRPAPGSPFPYEGERMNAKTGEPILRKTNHQLRGLIEDAKNRGTEEWDWEIINPILQSAGFNDWADVVENFVANIPTDLRNLVEWLNPFVDDNNNELFDYRPMLATWWD